MDGRIGTRIICRRRSERRHEEQLTEKRERDERLKKRKRRREGEGEEDVWGEGRKTVLFEGEVHKPV